MSDYDPDGNLTGSATLFSWVLVSDEMSIKKSSLRVPALGTVMSGLWTWVRIQNYESMVSEPMKIHQYVFFSQYYIIETLVNKHWLNKILIKIHNINPITISKTISKRIDYVFGVLIHNMYIVYRDNTLLYLYYNCLIWFRVRLSIIPISAVFFNENLSCFLLSVKKKFRF